MHGLHMCHSGLYSLCMYLHSTDRAVGHVHVAYACMRNVCMCTYIGSSMLMDRRRSIRTGGKSVHMIDSTCYRKTR